MITPGINPSPGAIRSDPVLAYESWPPPAINMVSLMTDAPDDVPAIVAPFAYNVRTTSHNGVPPKRLVIFS